MKKTKKPQFAISIIAKRKNLGFKSAREFAEHIRIPYGTYRDIEAGYSEGWPQTKEAIAKGLKCSIGELYGAKDPAASIDMASAAAFLSNFSTLSPKLQRVVWAIVFRDPKLVHEHPELTRALK